MKRILKILLCSSFIIAIFISVIDYCCFDYDFYEKEYKKCNVKETIGVSNEDLSTITHKLLNFLKDDSKTLDLEVDIKGELREVFNQKEKIHMDDVKKLYENALLVRNICGIISIILIVYFASQEKNNFVYFVYNNYKKSLIYTAIIFCILAFCILINFNDFWYSFHEIFFTNDYWLLDPRTDVLIMMVPSQFFFDLCLKIVIYSVVTLICVYLIIYLTKRYKYGN